MSARELYQRHFDDAQDERALLSALGFHFSPTTALCVLCLIAATLVISIPSAQQQVPIAAIPEPAPV